MIKRLLLTAAIMLFLSCIYSQDNPEYNLYMKNAEAKSVLYRGASPVLYRFFFTGSYFAYSDEYLQGEVLYNGKRYSGIMLNLNSNLDELYILDIDNGFNVVLNKDFVNSFSMGERDFINITDKELFPELTKGYYEILWSGNKSTLLKKIKKNYSEKINQGGNVTSKNTIERSFISSVQYFIVTPDGIKQVKNVSALRKIYKIKGSVTRKLIKENNLNIRKNTDVTLIMLMDFIHSGLLF